MYAKPLTCGRNIDYLITQVPVTTLLVSAISIAIGIASFYTSLFRGLPPPIFPPGSKLFSRSASFAARARHRY
ncbi:hypothetical protein [Burkholderia sp. Bp9090]|uniref:hypothetical protein n=1 Tax=Burkholderia sp. Bp9090 TaxID=2184567 RepID=UPI001C8AC9AD|nr:hypothetical protein [Burkholderia sp. Bp9090]